MRPGCGPSLLAVARGTPCAPGDRRRARRFRGPDPRPLRARPNEKRKAGPDGWLQRAAARSACLRAPRVCVPRASAHPACSVRVLRTCYTSCASDLTHLVLSNTFLGVRHLVLGWFFCARSQSAGPRALRLVADQYRHLNVYVKLFHARLVRELVTQSAPCVFNKFVCVF